MKKFGIFLACVCLLSLSVFAQTSKTTRPRVVAAPTPTKDFPVQTPTAKAPPTLKGDAGTSSAQPASPEDIAVEDDEIIRVETNLVSFPVSVLDRDGRFISGLQKTDFQIFENGIEQKIEEFASVQQPFTVILLIDVSPSTAFQIEEIQNAAIAFVDQLRENDKVIVIEFDEQVRVLSQATNNRATLRNAIRRAQFGDGTSLYEAVDYVINRELSRIEGRKAVVLFTDGVDTTSRRANYQSTVRATEETDALFYPIRYDTSDAMLSGSGGGYPAPRQRRGGGGRRRNGIGGILDDILNGGIVVGGGYPGGGSSGSSRAEYETGRKYLEELARNSGGRNFEASNNLTAAFTGIAEELRRQYSLGYYPEKVGQVGERKQIRVRVKRPNVAVRAKTSYIVGETDRKLAGK